MAHENLAKLDDAELLHLATQASRENRHDDALAFLRHSLERSPDGVQALYLSGALHAQIGMTERALQELARAVALQPGLEPARFQLGLLLLCNSRVDDALAAWAPLQQAGESSPYRHFAQALQRLCRDDFAGCRDSMLRGMELNASVPQLNADMQRVLDEAALLQQRAAPGEGGALAAYTRL